MQPNALMKMQTMTVELKTNNHTQKRKNTPEDVKHDSGDADKQTCTERDPNDEGVVDKWHSTCIISMAVFSCSYSDRLILSLST